ncbi:MAG: AmpG family muropeptide MFS transporter [Opitutae bacterium]|nr:AmpG family muropeptide MFS transporter [Opitutae bacterium]
METSATPAPQNFWRWIPSLYFAQGIPYVVVMTLAVVMYKNLKVSNTDIALYTSWLYLPWVIKPLWSPLVELFRTKRFWIVSLQLVIGAAFALVALTLPGPGFFRYTLAVFWLMAFSSATHDIAADGFYMLALPAYQQAAFVGVRSTFYRLAMIAGQGGLVYLAGTLQDMTGDVARAWSLVFGVLTAMFIGAGLYHLAVLPRPATDRSAPTGQPALTGFFTVFGEFFRKPGIGVTLAFLLLYRFAEAQLLKLVTPFLLDPRTDGGLGLTTQQVGIAYGTVGVIALTLGGLLGGYVISRYGLKRLLWPMILIMHVPNLVFVTLALTQPGNLLVIAGALAVEQFGYGFGFTAYMLYMIMVAEGEHKTAHYAICTGFMALGMMVPGMFAGWLQDHLGYVKFFLWVMLCTIPSFVAISLLKVDPAFGKKST